METHPWVPPVTLTTRPSKTVVEDPIDKEWIYQEREEREDDSEIETTNETEQSTDSAPVVKTYPRPNEELPDLSAEDNKKVDEWWDMTSPFYSKLEVDALIKRVETALTELPDLFIHLYLHEELLFELGGGLARKNRIPEYYALLKRIRREQPRMFSFCYGAYDSDIISGLIADKQCEHIPEYLSFFKEYPDAEPDYCVEVCDLLAWRGLDNPLYELCEAVAVPMLTSPDVIGGNFALTWLVRRELIPFLERGDCSLPAATQLAENIKSLGKRIEYPLKGDIAWEKTNLESFCLPIADAKQKYFNISSANSLCANFIAYLHRIRQVCWIQAFHLADHAIAYINWCGRHKKHPLRFRKDDLDEFLHSRARGLIGIKGVVFLSAIQTLVWFAEYAAAADAVSQSDVDRIKKDCEYFFEVGRKSVDSADNAYRICPSYAELIL